MGRTMKPVGKPDAGNQHVRFDERGRETVLLGAQPPRPSSTLLICLGRIIRYPSARRQWPDLPIVSFRGLRSRPLAEPYAHTAAVLVSELNASGLEHPPMELPVNRWTSGQEGLQTLSDWLLPPRHRRELARKWCSRLKTRAHCRSSRAAAVSSRKPIAQALLPATLQNRKLRWIGL